MIDFRYHVVSLIAIFLALAVGLVLGSTVLDKPVLEGAKKTADDLSHKNSRLRSDLLLLQTQEQASDSFVKAVAPQLLAGRLKKKRVVIVKAPGAGDEATDLAAGVKQAGGAVTGTVTLNDSYLAKDQVGVLGGLTDTLAKSTKVEVPTDAVPAQRAAILLSHALVTRDRSQLGESDDASRSIMNSFRSAKFLSTDGAPAKHASLALVVGPQTPYPGKSSANKNQAIVTLARQLDKQGAGSVLTAPTGSASDGVVSALRSNGDAKNEVSTVDDLDAPPGRLVTVLALALDAKGGEAGQWGVGSGADGVAPTPSPVKSP